MTEKKMTYQEIIEEIRKLPRTKEMQFLLDAVTIQEKALNFYADKKNYPFMHDWEDCPIMQDCGKKARGFNKNMEILASTSDLTKQ